MSQVRENLGPYDPETTESRWYRYWEENGFFKADRATGKPPHVIMMPPPNVTGALHMGHALQDSVQDAINRIRCMQGLEALWMPGKDHAGIATQNVVEKQLKENENLTRHDLGREAFLEHIWAWVDEYGGRILKQKRRLGDSCDWDRERFTMDAGYVEAVQQVFVRLYEEGLVYRGHYLVNWCPVDQTALSDLEVDNVEQDGFLWHIRYPLEDDSGHVVVATTRPETMLGDTAVAVHPDDERYADLIGKRVILPLMDRPIPIVADEYVQRDFGTGALKITPGHDNNDFETGKRHDLDVINVMALDGTINENGGRYAEMDRFVARDRIVEDLKALDLLEDVTPHRVSVPISQRSKAVVEPLLSRQWFVHMKPLASPAIAAVRDGRIRFYPKRWENEYFRWLEEIRDWCISRQLWWGHRIPVWYYTDESGQIDESRPFKVAVRQPEPGMVQDEDVLDTWFSSWLFPFATLGWPADDEDTRADLAYFHPTTVLVSGYDIIFFWIARMIMASLHFLGEVPYRDIFITGMVKDKYGRIMSKTLGNGIDPLVMIERYGADAVRFYLTMLCAQGQDIRLDSSGFEMGRNFATKIWNAFNVFGRFMQSGVTYRRSRTFEELELVEQWMLTRLNKCIDSVNKELHRYRLNEAVSQIYSTFRGDFCDWYLELVKPARGEVMSGQTIALAAEIYEQMLQLLHPFMPFITEELWHQLRPRKKLEACIVSRWPEATSEQDSRAANVFKRMQQIVTAVRNLRSRYNVPPRRKVEVFLSLPVDSRQMSKEIGRNAGYITRLANLSAIEVGISLDKPDHSASAVVGAIEIHVVGLVDPAKEHARLTKEIAQKEAFLLRIRKKLQNPQFVERAPESVVERERQKERDTLSELSHLQSNVTRLQYSA